MNDISKEVKQLRALVMMKNQSSVFAQSCVQAQKLVNGRNELLIDTINNIFNFNTTGYTKISISPKTSTISGLEYINDISVDDIDKAIVTVKSFEERITAVEEELDNKADVSYVEDNYVLKKSSDGTSSITYDLANISLNRTYSWVMRTEEYTNLLEYNRLSLNLKFITGNTTTTNYTSEIYANIIKFTNEVSGVSSSMSSSNITTPSITLNGNDLQTTLDGKASTNHTHVIADVIDLEDSLDSKVDTTFKVPVYEFSMGSDGSFSETEVGYTKVTIDASYECVKVINDVTQNTLLMMTHLLTMTNNITGDYTQVSPTAITSTGKVNANSMSTSSITLKGYDLQTTLDGKASTNHTHVIADITDLQTTLTTLNADISTNANDITELTTIVNMNTTGISEAIAQANFNTSNINTLTTTVNGKASADHTHEISDVTDLETTLENYVPKTSTYINNDTTYTVDRSNMFSLSSGNGDLVLTINYNGFYVGDYGSDPLYTGAYVSPVVIHKSVIDQNGITLNYSGIGGSTTTLKYSGIETPAITLNGTDLQTSLDSKMDSENPTFTGTLNGYNFSPNNSIWPCIPAVRSDGVMEVGRYMDWHYSSNDGVDYPMRMTLNSDYTLTMNKGLTVQGSLNATSIGSTLQTLILNMTYPVGVVYTSTVSTSPATLFGGTWTQITNRFLYCTTSSKATGGSTTITSSNLPSHTHSFSATTGSSGSHTHTITRAGYWSVSSGSDKQCLSRYTISGDSNDGSSCSTAAAHTHTVSGTSGSTGSGSAYYPPYMTVYAWYRTA